ncbi:DUF481 domain-containing protein [Algoriphagus aestuarii]|nr:DUF481 domain-containing protein [Algoriphagus aestuarii]
MKKYLLALFAFTVSIAAFSQTDSLVLNNNDLIVGEIKSMDKGIITIETDYSDSDFKITWDKIKSIISKTDFLITLSSGRRFNGKLNSVDSANVRIDYYDPASILRLKKSKVSDSNKETDLVEIVPISSIVYLNAVDKGFWSRLSANIDIGWSLTKANNLRQFNIRSGLGYLADRWKATASLNSLRSNQDDVEPVKRTDGGLTFNYFLPKDWFLLYNLTYLSNTEQLIESRLGNQIGLGKYIIHTNKTYFGFQTGVNLNSESYFDETPSRNSGEAMFGTQLNLYDIGDLNLLTTLTVYPSFTESGRWRSDFSFDIKYDFLDDFYVKLGTTMNFDNQPIEGATKLDYIFQTTIGWSL